MNSLLLSLALVSSYQALAQESTFNEIPLPDGTYPIRLECENPQTQGANDLIVIVRANDNQADQVLVNLTFTPPSSDPINACDNMFIPLDDDFAAVTDIKTGSVQAKLHSPFVNGIKTTNSAFAASSNLAFIVGMARYKLEPNDNWVSVIPMLWQKNPKATNVDDQYISMKLPIPKQRKTALDLHASPIPQFVTENGLTVFGNVYPHIYGGPIPRDYQSYQVVWTRKSINDPFIYHEMPSLHRDYPCSYFFISGISNDGSQLLEQEFNVDGMVWPAQKNGKDEECTGDYPQQSFLIQYDKLNNSFIKTASSNAPAYGIDPNAKFVWEQNLGDPQGGVVSVPIEHFSDREMSTRVSTNDLTDQQQLGVSPDFQSSVEFPQVRLDYKDNPNTGDPATIITLAKPISGSVVLLPQVAQSTSVGSYHDALDLLQNECKFQQTLDWKKDDWLFIYHGKHITQDNQQQLRLYGYHIGKSKSILFTADIPTDGCRNNNFIN